MGPTSSWPIESLLDPVPHYPPRPFWRTQVDLPTDQTPIESAPVDLEPYSLTWRARFSNWLYSAEFADVILPTLGIRLALLLFAPLSVILLGGSGAHPALPLNIWNIWDAPRYLAMAQTGYSLADQASSSVLLPLYPLLLRAGSLLLPALVAGLLLSLLFSLAAATGLYRLARNDGGSRPVARAAVLALNIFPTAFFLVPPYTEPLFLALVIWTFWRARQGHWITAGLLGLAATLTRIPGLLILPALLFELRGHRRSPRMLGLALIGLGPLIYLAINWQVYGDPLFFMGVERTLFTTSTVAPWTVLTNLVHSVAGLAGDYNWAILYGAPLVALILLALVVAWSWRSRRSHASYLVYAGLSLIFLSSLSWPISVPRYLLAVFPLFLMLGGLARSRWATPLAVGSVLLLGLFTSQFVLGHWIF